MSMAVNKTIYFEYKTSKMLLISSINYTIIFEKLQYDILETADLQIRYQVLIFT